MVDTSTNFPATDDNDVAEVSDALETARVLWSNGHALESVRWIQRAAENAESAGNDLRAVSLARAAADLRAEVNVSSEPPGPVTEAAALAPYDEFTESTIVDSPASSLARVAMQQHNVQIAELQPAAPAPAAAPAVAPAPPPPPPPMLAPPVAVSAPIMVSAPVVVTAPVSAPVAVPQPTPAAPAVQPAPPASYQALRVAVLSNGGGRERSVRLLDEGEALPAGASEALLISLDPKIKLI